MRALILALLVSTTACTSATPPAPQTAPTEVPQKSVNIAGSWKWEQGQERFDLVIKQDGNAITGYHAAVGQRGNKVDEVALAPDVEPSIKGELKGPVATLKFRSGYPDSTGGGTATLTLRGAFLYWQIVKSDGEHYLPKSAKLTRVKSR
jgi:hypothetical protein